jgi:magnesium transporter
MAATVQNGRMVPEDGIPASAGAAGLSATRCPTSTRQYRHGELLAQDFPPDEIARRLVADTASIIWLDMLSPDRMDLDIVTTVLGCHPLAVDDAAERGRRSVARRFHDHIFLNLYVLTPSEPHELVAGEMSVFITPRAFVTVRKDEIDIDTLTERWQVHPALRRLPTETAVLAYGVLDAIVDGHLAAAGQADDTTDELERSLFQEARDMRIRRRAYDLGVNLADLRRVVAQTREVVGGLVRTGTDIVDGELVPYLHDVLEQAQHNLEIVDSNRERLDRIVQTQLNEQGAQLNETTRRLAAWAAIIAVPTAVTGFYGQNVPYPGAGTTAGFITSAVIMLVMAAGLYWLLHRNRWL